MEQLADLHEERGPADSRAAHRTQWKAFGEMRAMHFEDVMTATRRQCIHLDMGKATGASPTHEVELPCWTHTHVRSDRCPLRCYSPHELVCVRQAKLEGHPVFTYAFSYSQTADGGV